MNLVRLRYVGDDRLRVPKLGRVVEPDDLVGVPRDVFARYAWPESLWRREDDDQDQDDDRGQDGGQTSAAAGDDEQSAAGEAVVKTRKAGGRDA